MLMKTGILWLFFLCPLVLPGQILLPGDANNDGRADHLDVLAVGLSYGQEGPPRALPFQNILWTPKPFLLWPGALPATGINHGFSDCNGNGLINEDDLKALAFNYDSLQLAAQPPPMPYAPPDTFFTSALPRLIFQFDKDTATVQDTVRLSIFYEQPPGLPAAESPLGLAFTLQFDEALVKDSLTRVFFEPSATDLLFAAGATGFADARAVPPGRVEFGVAGKGAPNLSFSRPLGVVEIVIVDVIVRADTFFTELKIDVAKPIMINALEQVLIFDVVLDNLVLFQELTTNQAPPEPLDFRVYPTLVHHRIQLELPSTPLARVQIVDAFGRLVQRQEVQGQTSLEFNTTDWPTGWYGVQLTAADGRVALKKVLKITNMR